MTTKQEPNVFRNYRIEHNEVIHFSVCSKPELEEEREKSGMIQLITKQLFSTYTDGQVRFRSANYLRKNDEPNPCESNICSIYAECVIDPESEEG